MACSTTTVDIPLSLVGRDVHRLVYRLQDVTSEVHFKVKGRSVNAKSLIGMFSAQIEQNSTVTIACHHDDIEQTKEDIKKVLQIIQELSVMDDGL